MKGFVAAFRPNATALQNTLAGVLLPDMLIVQTDKAPSTAGWLTWALANGYGGRKLTDRRWTPACPRCSASARRDSRPVCTPGALPLCTDNVGSHGGFTPTFPYLAPPK